jgi:hypothetical protein
MEHRNLSANMQMLAADVQTLLPQDIVLLQEVFVQNDMHMLVKLAELGGLSHHQYFHSGCLGGELLILSRWPIVYTRQAMHTLHFIVMICQAHNQCMHASATTNAQRLGCCKMSWSRHASDQATMGFIPPGHQPHLLPNITERFIR